MDEWNMRPGVINETVMAAKRFLEERPEELAKLGGSRTNISSQKEMIGATRIASFLGWSEGRVSDALSSLRDVESGIVDREAVEMMPLDLPPLQGYDSSFLGAGNHSPLCWPRLLDIFTVDI